MDQWLIRTAKNWIAGPYSKDQVCQMILGGSLGMQDEICAANGYWIGIHERKEVQEQLGIEVPYPHSRLDEVTENDIDTDVGLENLSSSESLTSELGSTADSGLGSSQLESESATIMYRPKTASRASGGESIAHSGSNESASVEEGNEDALGVKGWVLILLGLGLLVMISLRVFRH